MGVRPEDVVLCEDGSLSGEVFVVEPLGREDMIAVRMGSHQLSALVSTEQRIRAADTVRLKLKDDRLQFFDPHSKRSILWT